MKDDTTIIDISGDYPDPALNELTGEFLFPEDDSPIVESRDERFEKAKEIMAEEGLPVDIIIKHIETIIRSSSYLQDIEFDQDTVKDVVISIGHSLNNHKNRNKYTPSYIKIESTDMSGVCFALSIKTGWRNECFKELSDLPQKANENTEDKA